MVRDFAQIWVTIVDAGRKRRGQGWGTDQYLISKDELLISSDQSVINHSSLICNDWLLVNQ